MTRTVHTSRASQADRWRRCVAGGALVTIALAGCHALPGPPPQRQDRRPAAGTVPVERIQPPDPAAVWPPRAVWVVRQAYNSPEQIAAIMERSAQAGLNTVLFQVRGNATAYYRSRYEPWAEHFDFKDPGFDPLEVACREAHRRGLALHAWVNVMPAWRGRRPPADMKHLYHTHPYWFLHDQRGQRQALGDFYVSLNPCLPEVRTYLVNVMADIVARYPIDGLHLDYIRFPMESVPRGVDYPRDAATLRLYRAATGKSPDDDSAAWSRWRREQVTRLVAEIRQSVRRARPPVRLTAACIPDVDEARTRFFQDGPAWLRANLVDAVFVMNYTPDHDLFRRRHQLWRRSAPGRTVVPGLGVYMHDSPADSIAQLRLAEQWGHGFALFSYGALLERCAGGVSRIDALTPTLAAAAQRADTPSRRPRAVNLVP